MVNPIWVGLWFQLTIAVPILKKKIINEFSWGYHNMLCGDKYTVIHEYKHILSSLMGSQ